MTDGEAQELTAEVAATAFGAVVGGLCLALFGLQPASATGAMLQEAQHYVQPLGSAAGVQSQLSQGDAQLLVFLRFTVLLLALAAGTCIGRLGRIHSQYGPITAASVPLISAIGYLLTTLSVFGTGQTLPFWRQTWLCAIFGVAVGLLWGIMPRDHSTTARSSLMKRASLGDGWALLQVLGFLVVAGWTISTFHEITHGNRLHLVGVIIIGLSLAVSAYYAAFTYLKIVPETSPKPPRTVAIFASTLGLVLAAICTYLAAEPASARAAGEIRVDRSTTGAPHTAP